MDKNYFKVPNAVFTSALTKYEILVYCCLRRFQNNKEFSFPSYETIAHYCGISRSKAISTVKSLIKKRLLVKQVRPSGYRNNYSNLYKLLPENLSSLQHVSGSAHHAPKKELVKNNSNDTTLIVSTSDNEEVLND